MYSTLHQQSVIDHSTATIKLYESAASGLSALKDLLSGILNTQSIQIQERFVQWRSELPGYTQSIELLDGQGEGTHTSLLLLNNKEAFLCIPLDNKVELVVSGDQSALARIVHDENIHRIYPHINQALVLCHKVSSQKQDLNSIDKTLDHFSIPLLAVDDHLNTIFANKMAREKFSHVVETSDRDLVSSLRIQARDHIDFLGLCDTQANRATIRNAILTPSSQYKKSTGDISINGKRYPIIISATNSVPSLFRHYSRSSVAWIYILDAQYAQHIENSRGFRSLDLSKTEKELCILLFEGKSIADIAEYRRVADQTIRKQLQSILRKTNLKSQEELIIYLFENCIEYRLVM